MKKMISKIEAQEYPNIHSVLIAKNGELIFEKYFQGADENFGRGIGIVSHASETLHDIRSITKSIVSCCVGIAIDKRYIKSVDQRLAVFFPELDLLFEGEKSTWNIHQFLTMTTGLDWDESIPYDHQKNGEFKMTYSQDPVKYVLSQALINTPGETFKYNGGATQVLAEIIVRSSNMPLDQFVKENLFDPLGIENFEWNKYSVWGGADKFAAASGLRLSSPDLLKIGLLYRNNGLWNNRQIISSKWVEESFIQRVEFPSVISSGKDAYGYQFWMWSDLIRGNPCRMIAARGNGGQNIYWDLENDIIVVITAGNYNKWDIKNDSYVLLRNEIYPFLLKKARKKSIVGKF